jgi:type I restriction enzyme R subunit
VQDVFTPEEVNRFAELFVIQKAPGQKVSPLFTKIIQGRFARLTEEEQVAFRDALRRYVSQYSFISQIITWIDPDLENFYLFTKLLLKYLPPKKDPLPEEIIEMVDMDKFRLQEQQNGSIVLKAENAELENRYVVNVRRVRSAWLLRSTCDAATLSARPQPDAKERYDAA